jgi:CubicO group peptidase (beta-lactamase class C family)
VGSVSAGPAGSTATEDVARFLRSSARHYAFPALSCAIVTPGAPARFFGPGDGENADSVYKVGSLSKLVTALAILLLEEDGELRLEDPVAARLPWFAGCFPRPALPGATVGQLLVHAGGLPRGALLTEHPTAAEIRVAVEAAAPLGEDGPLGFQVKYSNLGYQVLGLVIEACAGEPYSDFVARRILQPLAMERSGYGRPAPGLDVAPPHQCASFEESAVRPYQPRPMPLYAAPHASMDLHSSPRDLAALLAALFAGTGAGKAGVFSADLVRTLLSTLSPMGGPLHAGPGFYALKTNRGSVLFENAEHFGHSAAMLAMPADGIAVAAFANRASGASELAFVVSAIERSLKGGGSAALGHDHPRPGPIAGLYRDESGSTLRIVLRGNSLYAGLADESPARLVYKGQHAFLSAEGALAKYVMKLDLQRGAIEGIIAGPAYYARNDGPAGAAAPVESAVAGFYRNSRAGRVALFARQTDLWLAFSPFKEARLERISATEFVQRSGPFAGEIVSIDAAARTLKANGLVFDRAEGRY